VFFFLSLSPQDTEFESYWQQLLGIWSGICMSQVAPKNSASFLN